ncbi:T9SS type A sorting domain-containing protein [Prolixibacteraceae bacterium Z1-6]|uniref:T9SS type A sorting domain-containing protein n=1 Tax=Draconibacterium aestuarii TaxID=2998507 RepID=A0A9X3F5T8_9BACT|nr:T9SS type A sorting domain-containing protein [Prolixibacteraceae bacterium Z1-6]
MKRIILLLIAILSFPVILTAQNQQWETFFAGKNVTAITIDTNYIWVGVDSLLVKIDKSTKASEQYNIPNPYHDMGLETHLYRLINGKDGLKWMICSGPLPYVQTFDGENWQYISTPTNWISSIVADTSKQIWLGTVAGLFSYDGTSWIPHDLSASGLILTAITSMAIDQHNNKWLAAVPGLGAAPILLIKYNADHLTIFSPPGSLLPEVTIGSIAVSKDETVWLGTFDEGVLKLDAKGWTVFNTSNSELKSNEIHQIATDEYSTAWLATANGLFSYNGTVWQEYNSANSHLPSNNIFSVIIDNDGTKYIGTDQGLTVLSEDFVAGAIFPENNSTFSFQIFPNPATELLTIRMPSELQKSLVEICDIHGKLINNFTMTNTERQINISDLPTGMYFIKLRSDNTNCIKKFIKQ